MGAVNTTASHTAVMPEVLVQRGDEFLLVRGTENGRTFWWPPGAYWMQAGTCELADTDPVDWIRHALRDQIEVEVSAAALRGVSLIDVDHAPVLTYAVTIEGEPQPNERMGFDRAEFFAANRLPTEIGRDRAHARWLRDLLSTGPVAPATGRSEA